MENASVDGPLCVAVCRAQGPPAARMAAGLALWSAGQQEWQADRLHQCRACHDQGPRQVSRPTEHNQHQLAITAF